MMKAIFVLQIKNLIASLFLIKISTCKKIIIKFLLNGAAQHPLTGPYFSFRDLL